MFRGLRVPLAVALVVATLGGCASGSQPTSAQPTSQPSTRSLSRAASPAETPATPTPPISAPPEANPSPQPVPKGTGIAGGTLLMNCPADRVDPPCAGVPVRACLAVLNATTQAVITDVNTDAGANFTVALSDGTYLLRPVKVGSQAARHTVVTRVTVTA